MKARLLGILLILIFALAGAVSASEDRETIVFWYGATADERAAYDQMISEFERANPDIRVNAMLVPQSYLERKLILSVAGGVPPDVVRFYAHLGGEMMSRGGIGSLDDLIERDKLDLKDFYKVGIEQNTYRGKLYGIPWVLSPNALFYNKQLFRKAGLDPNKPPKTWAELESYALKLTKRDKDGLLEIVGYGDFLYNPNNFALYLWQSGGELLSKDGKTPEFNSTQGKAVLRWMKSFLDKEAGGVKNLQIFGANFKGATQDPFGQGRVAMRIDSPFRIPDLKKYFPNLEYGIAMIPYSKQRAIEVVGNSLVIPRGSQHREAAWRFIKFASSPEQVRRICMAGRIPARISAAHAKEFYGNPLIRPFIDSIPYGHSVPIVPGWQEVSAGLASGIESGLKGDKSIDAALDDSAALAKTVLSRASENMAKFPIIPWKAIGIIAGALLIGGCIAATMYVRKRTAHSTRERDEARQFYMFAAPWLVGFFVFTFGAMVASLIISFSKWDTLSPAHFVGVRNYADMFSADAKFYKSIFVTLYYAVFSIPLAIVGGLLVSILMNQKILGIRIFRTIYYLPVVISGVATAYMWLYVFNPTTGLINKFLTLNVIPGFADGKLVWNAAWATPPAWLQDADWALPAFIIMGIWGVGGSMIIYLAALQGVPEDLYEAAKIDGAGAWKTFLNVTLPLLTPAIFYQLVVGTMYALQMFVPAYIMTGGGPNDSTLFYGLYLYKNAFEWLKLGYASSMAWILFMVVLAITLIHFKGASRWVYYEGKK